MMVRSDDRSDRPRIAITLGDPNGVGPEIVLKSLLDVRMLRFVQPLLVGSEQVLHTHLAHLGYDDPGIRTVRSVPERWESGEIVLLDGTDGRTVGVSYGKVSAEAGALAMQWVELAARLCLDGHVDGMVTAPINKEAVSKAGFEHPGHTEFIASLAGCSEYAMMMVSDTLRVGLVTGHLPIRSVPRAITRGAILEKIRVMHAGLMADFGIQRPKIAVLGLNPHAGDGGVLGKEERETIVPAVQKARREGRLAFGPFPADGFFAIGAYRLYDVVLAMYHDQGLIPFKALAFESGVNYTVGLPIVRTSPDHGTAFDIAGTGRASPEGMRSAIYLAMDVVRRRASRRY